MFWCCQTRSPSPITCPKHELPLRKPVKTVILASKPLGSWRMSVYWIYDYPSGYIGALFAFVFVATTCLGILFFRRRVRSWIHSERRANDMIAVTLATVSVLYGLLLGLLAVGASQNFSSASDIVTREASSLAALYRDLGGYPQPIRGNLRGKLRDYTRYVIEESWPQQRRGIVPAVGSDRITAFYDELLTYNPTELSREIVYAETLRQFDNLVETRRSRLANVTAGIPGVFWWVVALGAVLNIALICMLDMEVHVHLLLGGAMSLFLGIVIFMIAALDNPFRGEVSIGPDPIQLVYETLMNSK